MTTITTQTDDLDPDTTFVLHGDTDLGTIRDERNAIATRGRYCAWSPKGSHRRDGIIGFFTTKDEAAAAIAKAHGIQPELSNAKEWAGTHTRPFSLHRFDVELKAQCNRRIQSRGRGVRAGVLVGHDELFTRREIETGTHPEFYTFCPRCESTERS